MTKEKELELLDAIRSSNIEWIPTSDNTGIYQFTVKGLTVCISYFKINRIYIQFANRYFPLEVRSFRFVRWLKKKIKECKKRERQKQDILDNEKINDLLDFLKPIKNEMDSSILDKYLWK